MADGKITVSVEQAIHTVLKELVQDAFDVHGVMVTHVTISWADRERTIGELRKAFIEGIVVHTITSYADEIEL